MYAMSMHDSDPVRSAGMPSDLLDDDTAVELVAPRLMLVDDEPNILNSLRRAINGMPAALFGGRPVVETFDDPRKALARAGECAFDLVLSDYRMPNLNGVQFLGEIKKLQPGAARLILSGFADLTALVAAINDVQIFRFIAKPWDDYDIGASIAQALEHRKLQQENIRLANLVRVQQGLLSDRDVALQALERRYPGLTQVKRGADGSIDLDLDMDMDDES